MSARSLGWGFAVLCAATFALIVLGALVRAKGAGLACPDWPLCFGSLVPTFDAKIAFEWSHRALAGGVALGLLWLSTSVWRRPELWARLGRLLALAWGLLAVQMVLGGLTVLLLLASWTVTAHLLFGTSFCVALLWIARSLFELGAPAAVDRAPVSSGLAALVGLATALLASQIALGGLVASRAAGLACANFPTCDGEAMAPTLTGLVGLHVLHRLSGYALVLCYAALLILARRQPVVGPLAWTAVHLLILQVGLGALNVLLRLPVEVTALHSATAAAIALVTALIAREVWLSAGSRAELLEAG